MLLKLVQSLWIQSTCCLWKRSMSLVRNRGTDLMSRGCPPPDKRMLHPPVVEEICTQFRRVGWTCLPTTTIPTAHVGSPRLHRTSSPWGWKHLFMCCGPKNLCTPFYGGPEGSSQMQKPQHKFTILAFVSSSWLTGFALRLLHLRFSFCICDVVYWICGVTFGSKPFYNATMTRLRDGTTDCECISQSYRQAAHKPATLVLAHSIHGVAVPTALFRCVCVKDICMVRSLWHVRVLVQVCACWSENGEGRLG